MLKTIMSYIFKSNACKLQCAERTGIKFLKYPQQSINQMINAESDALISR